MGKAETEAQAKLAEAMNKLASSLERFQDPVVWQKIFRDAVLQMPALGEAQQRLLEAPAVALPQGVRIDTLMISLSDEERQKLVAQISEAVQPQLVEFGVFVTQALSDMPAGQLKRIADKVAAGETPTLKRRQGCIFVSAGDEEVYLRL
jgi:hypothetical protein